MKEKMYILFINNLTQIAIVVDNKNNFSLRTMEQIIDNDKIEYEPVTKEQRCTLYQKFIKDNPQLGLTINKESDNIDIDRLKPILIGIIQLINNKKGD